jgi:NarL family two-component system response regulator LiaR
MIRVMLVNDFPLIGNLVSASLEDEPLINVVKISSPDEDLIANIRKFDVNMVLISGRLSTVKTIELVSQINAMEKPLEILILGLEEHEKSVLPLIEAGASGYVLKDASVGELIDAIHTAHKGRARISPKIARSLIERVYHLAGEFDSLDRSIFEKVELTTRELEVLELIAQDMTNQEIAESLFVEVGTIKNHVHSILQKLDVNSRYEAAKYLAILKR